METEERPLESYVCSEKTQIEAIQSDLSYLKDLFARRLYEDKQKAQLIQTLSDTASFACIEPFLYDLILLIDRMERTNDETAQSVSEELYEILERRGVRQISVGREFDPSFHKAIRVTHNSSVTEMQITGIGRNGYTFNNKVLRPAEVFIEIPDDVASRDN